MLRDLLINGAKAPNAMYKAKVAMKTGMAVVKSDTTDSKYAVLPTAATAENVYFVQKERVPKGINCMKAEMSDYDEDFMNVEANEFITLEKYAPGERFAIDQYTTTDFTAETAIDTPVVFGTDGKAAKAETGKTSIYLFKGFHEDNGHVLAVIEVSDTAVTAA